jgi:hypothetical protein
MSYSSSVKNQLSRIECKACCTKAELAAIIATAGVFIANNGLMVKLLTENAAMARRFFSEIKTTFQFHPKITIRKSSKLKKRMNYIITMTTATGAEIILQSLGIELVAVSDSDHAAAAFGNKIDGLLRDECCRRSFLRGAFLAGGSVSDPEKAYHLEIAGHHRNIIQKIAGIMAGYGLNGKVIRRKENYLVYLKEGENIVDFLNIIGAHKALLEIENIRILKEMRNSVNRMVNCETANLDKTVDASVRQINNIKLLEKQIGLNNIPKSLAEVAVLRKKYPDDTLRELGLKMSPPLGKSGVNHRLMKLEELAESLKRR